MQDGTIVSNAMCDAGAVAYVTKGGCSAGLIAAIRNCCKAQSHAAPLLELTTNDT